MDRSSTIKITTDSYTLTPPQEKELPPCPRCFEPTTGLRIEAPDLASRTKAKLLAHPLPNMLAFSLPCGHQLDDAQWQAWKSAVGLETDVSLNDATRKTRSPKRKKRK